MRRFATFGAALPLLALGAACSDNNTPAAPAVFRKVDMLSDFEAGSVSLNKDPRWDGSWAFSVDQTAGRTEQPEVCTRPTPDSSCMTPPPPKGKGYDDHAPNPYLPASTKAYHVVDFGGHTQWGSAWFAALNNERPLDLSGYTGISIWARSDNFPPPTVKVSLPDAGSYPNAKDPATGLPVCDMNDITVGGKGCYDDYSVRIYPDGMWRRYDIPFASLVTGGYGLKHDFDPTKVYALKFSMLPSTTYSVWIDDVTLYLQ